MDVHASVADERRRIADLIDVLSPAQLAAPSLCGGWTVQQVAGHLLAAIDAPPTPLLSLLVRSGFNLHRANARLAVLMADRPSHELATGLRANADNPFQPPIVGYPGQLTDLQVHGQDIRRPLGLPHGLQSDRLEVSLKFLTSGRAIGFAPRRRLAGLHFVATDLAWSWGTGPEVSGAAEALMMAMTGRDTVLTELEGAGVDILTGRLKS